MADNNFKDVFMRYWPILFGLLLIYTPTYFILFGRVWQNENNEHGMVIFFIILWIIWDRREAIVSIELKPEKKAGWILLSVGLFFFTLGRPLEILLFEVGSQIPVFIGVMLISFGWDAVKKFWFALFLLLFLIPIPSILIDALTGSLKNFISYSVVELLYQLGFPIAKSGIVITIGQYQLMVADACSGLNSIFSLTALGFIFAYMKGYSSKLKIALFLSTILPIAIIANLIRVLSLTLTTYYLGESTGLAIHDYAAFIEFMVALFTLFLVDSVLTRFFKDEYAES